jgi:hypothetical protein
MTLIKADIDTPVGPRRGQIDTENNTKLAFICERQDCICEFLLFYGRSMIPFNTSYTLDGSFGAFDLKWNYLSIGFICTVAEIKSQNYDNLTQVELKRIVSTALKSFGLFADPEKYRTISVDSEKMTVRARHD